MRTIRRDMAELVNELTASPDIKRERLAWAGLDNAELSRPGGKLFAALMAKASQRGEQLRDVADALGCSYSYLSQLRTGVRKVPQISDEMVDSCAQYLQWPRLAVLVASGKIRAEDLFEEPLRMPAMLDQALALIRDDPAYGVWFPSSLMNLDDAGKHFIVRLYEDATKLRILPYDEPEEIPDVPIPSFP